MSRGREVGVRWGIKKTYPIHRRSSIIYPSAKQFDIKNSQFFPVWIFNFQLSLLPCYFFLVPLFNSSPIAAAAFFSTSLRLKKCTVEWGAESDCVYEDCVDIGKKWAAAAIFYSSLNNDYFFYRLYFQFLF